MTNRLTIQSPTSSIILISDSGREKLEILSDFCKKELGAWHSTEDIDELSINKLSGEQSNQLYSLLFELQLL